MSGDGKHLPWMDKMQREGLKFAKITVEFTWRNRGRELSNWNIVSTQYFRDYDCQELVSIEASTANRNARGLKQELEEAALLQAKNGNWIEYPSEKRGVGYRVVGLADSEWLPVNLPPSYGEYDQGTTSLMHAALLGDVSRMVDLIHQGENISSTSHDGTTPLIYAAVSDNPLAVETLLKAGARVNTMMKGGGNALTAAVVTNHRESVDLLLKAGADPNSRGPEGESALSIAERQRFLDIVQLLTHAGARF
jgi:hypothetical protein